MQYGETASSSGLAESGYSDFSYSTSSSGPKNTWRKEAPKKKKVRKKKPKTPEILPTPDPVERFVYVVPMFEGKQKNILSAESGRQLILLHSLTSAITLSNQSGQSQLPANITQRFTISKKLYEGLS